MTEEKPEEKQEKKPVEAQEKKPETAPTGTGEFEQLMTMVQGMNQRMGDMEQAISALANQGAVNESIDEDNGNGEDDYPTIDLDKLMGV